MKFRNPDDLPAWESLRGSPATSPNPLPAVEEDFSPAYDPVLKRPVSIRRVPDFLASDPDLLRQYRQLAERHTRLNHPNILALYEMNDERLVTERVEGVRLSEFLQVGPDDRRAFTRRFAEQFLPQLLAGLECAHIHGVVHRCLTPHSIWLFPNGQVKLWGFGLAFLEISRRLHSPLELPAEYCFMAPEQARGEKADRRSDIWAVGVLLYLLETGRYPFSAGNLPDLTSQILKGRDLSEASAMVQRCLQVDPARRFQTVSELLPTPLNPLQYEHAPLHHQLALNYYRQRKFELAKLEWQKACDCDPHQPAYRNNLGAAFYALQQFDDALECFQQSENRFNQGLALRHLRRFREATAVLGEAAALHPRSAGVYLLLGECLLESGRAEQALQEFQRALILNPRSARGLRNLVRAYESLDQRESAAAYASKADEAGPEEPIEPLLP